MIDLRLKSIQDENISSSISQIHLPWKEYPSRRERRSTSALRVLDKVEEAKAALLHR